VLFRSGNETSFYVKDYWKETTLNGSR